MIHTALTYGALTVLTIALAVAVVTDLTRRLIYNWLVVIVAIGAPVYWFGHGERLWPDVPVHLLVALIVFGLFLLAFQFGMMGGGDVKLFAAIALWFSWTAVIDIIFIASLLGGAVTIAAAIHHRWRNKSGPIEVPYGVAIAGAGLWFIGQRYFNHFA